MRRRCLSLSRPPSIENIFSPKCCHHTWDPIPAFPPSLSCCFVRAIVGVDMYDWYACGWCNAPDWARASESVNQVIRVQGVDEAGRRGATQVCGKKRCCLLYPMWHDLEGGQECWRDGPGSVGFRDGLDSQKAPVGARVRMRHMLVSPRV